MDKKKLKRYLLILIPLIPIPILLVIPGFVFSAFICLMLGLLTGLYVTLSLFPGRISRILHRILTVLVGLGILLATGTELYLVTESKPDSEPCDYVIVLGAGVNGSDPSLMLQNRIDRAFAYLTDNPDVICVVSGGQGDHEDISEAECMYRELTQMGIASERIWQENQSTSTVENLKFSVSLIKEKTGVSHNPCKAHGPSSGPQSRRHTGRNKLGGSENQLLPARNRSTVEIHDWESNVT